MKSKRQIKKGLLVNSNKPILFSRIKFVIPDKFKDVENKTFLFLVLIEVVEELVQISMIKILIHQHFKILGWVFFNRRRKLQSEQGGQDSSWRVIYCYLN